jgi:hypothetical protein
VECSGSLVSETSNETSDRPLALRRVKQLSTLGRNSPVNSSKFSPSNGEISIGTKFILVHEAVKWAIHGLDLVLLVLDIHLIEHVRPVKIEMTRRFPQIQVCDVRGVYDVITPFLMRVFPKVFNKLTNFRSFGMPENKTTSSVFLSREKANRFSKRPTRSQQQIMDPIKTHLNRE